MATKSPTFSFVVPVSHDIRINDYCGSISECVGAKNCEHIMILNAASPEVRKIIDEFVEDNQRVIILNLEERSIQKARNAGIDHATGKWIINLDSDVTINKEFLSEVVSTIHNNPKADIIVPKLLREPGKTWFQRMTAQHFINLARREKPPVHNPGLIVKSSVYDDIGRLDPLLKYGNDNDFKRKIKDRNIAYAHNAIVLHAADRGRKTLKQHFKYGIDRSRLSRTNHLQERSEILWDRFKNLIFLPKFIRHLSLGFEMAIYEAFIGVVTATGFWAEEFRSRGKGYKRALLLTLNR